MEIVEFGALTSDLRGQLEGDEHDPFDTTGIELQFRAKDRHVALRDLDGRLVASTGMLVVDVDVGDERIPVVGLGGVIVTAGYRGRGLGRRVVEEALARARTMGPAFALLFCLPSRVGLYRKLDFDQVTSPVSVEQPDGITVMPLTTMWRGLADREAWPPGPVALRSLPF